MENSYRFISLLSALRSAVAGLLAMIALTACIDLTDQVATQERTEIEFNVSFPVSVNADPLDGRIILVLSKTEDFNHSGVADGSPTFGVDVENFVPGQETTLGGSLNGDLIPSLNEIPPGEYFVIAYLDVYTTFHRSDGHIVKLPMDQGEGQQWYLSPGNLHSEARKIEIKANTAQSFALELGHKIAPIEPPSDTQWVKNISIRSDLVSEFWGTDMNLSARVLLPKGFDDNPDARYPLIIEHGHFSDENPGEFVEPTELDPGSDFYQVWTSEDYPRFLLATIQHPTPYYDDSYAVNSANMGPYGDAINYELLPEIESRFRAIGEPSSRALTGCSTGGWITLATQVWYPDMYAGAWVFAPDQVDFHYYELVNLYEPQNNAYYREYPWSRLPLPAHRDIDGRPAFSNEQENIKEEVAGSRYRSGGQWAAWNALFGPVAEDGYPKPLWNPLTGEIDPVIAQWMIERYDLTYYLRENWSEVGSKLVGKLHFFTGRKDNWYIEQAIYLLEEFFEGTKTPAYRPDFHYGIDAGHCWSPWEEDNDAGGLYREMIQTLERKAGE
jgi:hypothetical protein